ncbi:MAG: molybdopterin-dependent oxidoreductase [Atribacterota bacterium]|nr:molybdopterin-dependent oxidoreductase [Atribacterota bacterium]MDD5636686.1 molybdopterin-dependent oxidoreductase [Atribacterota bacterium]
MLDEIEHKFDILGKDYDIKNIGKVTGEEKYSCDINIPGQLYAVVLRSPYAHAEIKEVDYSEAEQMGAICIGPQDVPEVLYNERIVSIPAKTYRDRTVLPKDKVRHVGEAIAACAAETEEKAFAALKKIKVVWGEKWEPLVTLDDAMAPAAPAIYEQVYLGDDKVKITGNLACERNIEVGDIEEGLRQADIIAEETFEVQRVYHMQLETKSAVCQPEANGGFTLWTTTQGIHNVRILLGQIFSIPLSRINVKRTTLGGSFGSSIQMNSITPICVALALKARRPVKLVTTREEDMYDHSSYPLRTRLKVGAKKDGTLTAAHCQVWLEVGGHNIQAYPYLGCVAGWFASLYKWKRLKYEGKAYYSNKGPACARRGYGSPQVNFPVENMMDILAEKLGIDPIQFRLQNYVGKGDEFWGQGPTVRSIIRSCGVEEMLVKGAELIQWERRKELHAQKGPIRRGIGVARGFHTSGTGGPKAGEVIDYSGATVKINEDGSVDVITALMDHGGGTWEAGAKVAAEVLKVPFEKVSIDNGVDTRTTVFDVNTHATRGIYCGCAAIKFVAEKVKEMLLDYAATLFEDRPENLVLALSDKLGQGIIYPKDLPEKYKTIAQIADHARINSVATFSYTSTLRQKNCPPCFITYFTEVEVNTQTGDIAIPKVVMFGDSGTIINPELWKGQILGAYTLGIGLGKLESIPYDPLTGKLGCNGLLTDSKIPLATDMPYIDEIIVDHAHTYEPTGPFGAKGIGEAALSAVASSFGNAVYDAVGIRFTKLPITPEVMLKALQEKRDRRDD